MRIVFLRSNPVNPDSRVEKEVNSLIKEGYDVKIVAWDRGKKHNFIESILNLDEGRVKIYRCGIPATYGGGMRKNIIPLIKFQIKLFQWLYLNRKEFDVIHACDFDTALIACIFAKMYKKKLVYDIFDFYVDSYNVPSYLKKIIKKVDYYVINSANAVIICSEQRKEQIKGSNPKQIIVLHNTPKMYAQKFCKLKSCSTNIKIVYVGILSRHRFLEEIVDVIKNNENFEFHVGGFGELERYFEQMSKKYKNIIYYGKMPYNKTLELEASCDIMVAIYDPKIPNHKYSAPNKFYEALMLGKPIIMAKNTGMSNYVIENDIGEVIEYDKESFKSALENLSKRKSQWKEISNKMQEIYRLNYDWRIMEDRFLKLYEEISLRG